jgi:hypothetical protein
MHTRETHHNFSEPSLAPSRNCLASLRVRHRLRFLLCSNTKHPPTILQLQTRLNAASPGHCCWRFGTSTEHPAMKLGECWWPTPSVLGPENRELILKICCAQLGRGVQPGPRLLCRSASCLQDRLGQDLSRPVAVVIRPSFQVTVTPKFFWCAQKTR